MKIKEFYNNSDYEILLKWLQSSLFPLISKYVSNLFNNSLFVTLGLMNSSSECDIDTMEIQVFVLGFNMTGLNRYIAK